MPRRPWIALVAFALATLPLADTFAAPVTFRTTDGVTVSADAEGTGTQAVVFVHGEGRSRADWAPLVSAVARGGLLAINLDLRGHGNTPMPAGVALDATSWPGALRDVQAAVTYARSKGAKDVTLMGADVGGLLTLAAAAADPQVTTVVLASPKLSGAGVKVTDALAGLGTRPLLLFALTNDPTGVKNAGALRDRAAGPNRLELIDPGTAPGTSPATVLARNAKAEGLLLSWVRARGRLDASGNAAPTQATVETPGEVKTSGTKIGEAPKP
jgi:alpha-beta hydrolase superfamily lysophospholipase